MLIKVIIVIVIIALLAIIGLTAVVIVNPSFFDKNRKKDNNNTVETPSPSISSDVADTKDYIPNVEFYDYAFGLGNNTYRALVDCTSLNYDLMGEIEQEMVDASFSRFLNSLTFPVFFYIQTREFDKETMMENLENNVQQSIKRFPSINEYSDMYISQMKYLPEYIGNTKTKKKFIIVPLENSDLSDMPALSDEEVTDFALEELATRTNIVCSAIGGCGIDAHVCDKGEIAECIFSYFHRDFYKIAKGIIDGIYTTLAVNSSFRYQDSIEVVLNEAQNRLKKLSKADEAVHAKFYSYLINSLEEMKVAAINNSLDTLMGVKTDNDNEVDEEFLEILESQGIFLDNMVDLDFSKVQESKEETNSPQPTVDKKAKEQPSGDGFVYDEDALLAMFEPQESVVNESEKKPGGTTVL